jgi:hypothetical protein
MYSLRSFLIVDLLERVCYRLFVIFKFRDNINYFYNYTYLVSLLVNLSCA